MRKLVYAHAAALALSATAESFDFPDSGPGVPGSRRYPGQMNKRLDVVEPRAKVKSEKLRKLLKK